MTKPASGRFWLAPDVHCITNRESVLIVGETAAVEVRGDAGRVAAALDGMRAGASCEELCARYGPMMQQLLSRLVALNWIVTEHDDAVRSGRFGQLFGWFASKTSRPLSAMAGLERARAVVLGVGGLGTQVIDHLVGAGVRKLILVDGDVVEPSNLNRQYMFDQASIGRRKVEVAAERIGARNSAVEVTLYDRFVTTRAELSILDHHNIAIVVNCADQPAGIDSVVAEYCEARGAPFLTAGVGLNRGYWGPLLVPGATCSFAEFAQGLADAMPQLVAAAQGSVRCTSSFGPFNSIVGSFLAADVLRALSGAVRPASLGRRIFVDFDELRMTFFPEQTEETRRTAPEPAGATEGGS